MTVILRPLMPPAVLISSFAIMMALCVDWPKVACAPVSDPYSPMRMSPLLLAAFPAPPPAVSFFGGQPKSANAIVMVNSLRKLRLMIAIPCKTWAHSSARPLLEADFVTDSDHAAVYDLAENARSPLRLQGLL